ncbi:hypothetical protein L7F22_059322, partial [Adiantum nelumboides]|nr:hypothetical protein [Adiantum nelumboides]
MERAFGRLKNAWRILNGTIKSRDIYKVPKVIIACCMLHNLAIDHGMDINNEMDGDLAANRHHTAQNFDFVDAINAETAVTNYLDELYGTH